MSHAGRHASRRTPHGPVILALCVLGVTAGASIEAALSRCGGRLVYALDDAYIHMTMARTLAESGVWGISEARPAFASSSPGWTLLLAGLRWVGLWSDWVPLVLNLVAAVALVVVADRAARRVLVTERARMWLLVSLVLVTPMPALVLAGMEALWQVAAALAFVSVAARVSARPDVDIGPADHARLLGLAMVMVALRYESLFLAAGAVAVLTLRRRFGVALAVACAAFVPVVTYAVFSVSHGGWWLPASVVMKGQPPMLHTIDSIAWFVSDKGFPALFTQWPLPPILLSILALVFVLTWRDPALEGEAATWLLIVGLAVILHVHLVNTEWFYRYRAYLVATGVVAIAFGVSRAREVFLLDVPSLRSPRVRCVSGLFLMASVAGPLAFMAGDALGRGPRGSQSTFLQQYQVAGFLAADGTGAVALNDIGAVSYLTRRPIVDLAGLADQRIAETRRVHSFSTTGIAAATNEAGADVAVIYESWFEGKLAPPPTWVRVARWTAAEHVTTAGDTVSFFATNAEKAPRLREALRAWTLRLPTGISVAIDDPPGASEP